MSERRVVLICTGRGTHGRVKLGEWSLAPSGYAHTVDRPGRGDRPVVDVLRSTRSYSLDVTCQRCTARHSTSPSAMGERGVRNIRATPTRFAAIVRAALDSAPTDQWRVVLDVSTPTVATLF